jgi:hypothetical protein
MHLLCKILTLKDVNKHNTLPRTLSNLSFETLIQRFYGKMASKTLKTIKKSNVTRKR